MRVATALVAVAVLSAGCSAFAGQQTPTVTPAPLPEATPTPTQETATATRERALAAAPTFPCGPRGDHGVDSLEPSGPNIGRLPLENGTVNTTALAARHDATLVAHGYRLEAPDYRVAATPGLVTFSFSRRTQFYDEQWYATNGTLYMHETTPSGFSLANVSYDPDRLRGISRATLTGADVIARTTEPYEYVVGGETTIDGDRLTVVRVAEGPPPPVVVSRDRRVTALASRLLVDDRGFVRAFHHEVEWRSGTGETGEHALRMNVTALGVDSVTPPPAFCS